MQKSKQTSKRLGDERHLNPGDLLIRRYTSAGYDISLVTHTSSSDIAECIVIFVTENSDTDLYQLRNRGFLRDRSQSQDDEIIHADI